MYIRKGDTVQVVAGDDKGKVGLVLRVLREENKVVVQGINRSLKHIRPNQRNPKGGRLSVEKPINASNVLLFNSELGKGVRVGLKVNQAGEKVRYCKKTGREMGVLRRPAGQSAKK